MKRFRFNIRDIAATRNFYNFLADHILKSVFIFIIKLWKGRFDRDNQIERYKTDASPFRRYSYRAVTNRIMQSRFIVFILQFQE